MPDPKDQFSPKQIDALVASYLEEEARQDEASGQLPALAQRIALARPLAAETLTVRAPRRAVKWAVGMAASLLLAAAGLHFLFMPESTSAYSIVSAAERTYSPLVERCYRVEVDAPRGWIKTHPLLGIGPHTRLWTRGNQFCVLDDRQGGELVWGQDEKRKIWFSVSGEYGLEFEPRAVPPTVAAARTFLHLNLPRLMKQMLRSPDLVLESHEHDGRQSLRVVRARVEPKRGRLSLDTARLEIDVETNVIHRLQLSRTVENGAEGSITFTLLESEPTGCPSFQLTDHLPPTAPVYRGEAAFGQFQRFRAESGAALTR